VIMLLALFMLVSTSYALRQHALISFYQPKTTQYLNRFAVDNGSMLNVRVKVRTDIGFMQNYENTLELLLMNDQEWEMALQTED
jgi:hypothetical protein